MTLLPVSEWILNRMRLSLVVATKKLFPLSHLCFPFLCIIYCQIRHTHFYESWKRLTGRERKCKFLSSFYCAMKDRREFMKPIFVLLDFSWCVSRVRTIGISCLSTCITTRCFLFTFLFCLRHIKWRQHDSVPALNSGQKLSSKHGKGMN
jgi:hypothetical protein